MEIVINNQAKNKTVITKNNKDFTDMTLSDMWDACTWDNTCNTAEEAWDGINDAVTNTSINNVTDSISSGWDSVCSFFSSDDDK